MNPYCSVIIQIGGHKHTRLIINELTVYTRDPINPLEPSPPPLYLLGRACTRTVIESVVAGGGGGVGEVKEGPVLQGRRARISDRPAGRANRRGPDRLGRPHRRVVFRYRGRRRRRTFMAQYYNRPKSKDEVIITQ